MNIRKALGKLGAVSTLLVGLSLYACGPTTTFASSWRAPTAEPFNMKGQKVAAVIMMQNEATRRNAEDVLAREITHYGAKGIPMYSLVPGGKLTDEATARAAIERNQVQGVVVMRPKGTRKKTETHTYSDPMYGGYWGGYYPYGWGAAWYPPNTPRGNDAATPQPYFGGPSASQTVTTTTEVVVVEILVYSLKQNILVWAGESETTDVSNVDDFVTQLAGATARELADVGLLSN